MFKKLILAAIVATSFAAVPLTASARTVFVEVAPPAMRVEVVPAPRHGSEWAPGHWEWRHERHVWVAGSWMRARRGYGYEPHRWVEDNGRWQQQPGHWVRTRNDRDGDGVPNRSDRAPNNPNRS